MHPAIKLDTEIGLSSLLEIFCRDLDVRALEEMARVVVVFNAIDFVGIGFPTGDCINDRGKEKQKQQRCGRDDYMSSSSTSCSSQRARRHL